MEEKFFPPD